MRSTNKHYRKITFSYNNFYNKSVITYSKIKDIDEYYDTSIYVDKTLNYTKYLK